MRPIDADRLRGKFPEPTDWRDIEQVIFHISEIWAAVDAAPTLIMHDSEKDARWIPHCEGLPETEDLTDKQKAELYKAFREIVKQYKQALTITYVDRPLEYAMYNAWRLRR